MSVEGCSSYGDEGLYSTLEGLPSERRWNGHTITLYEEGLGTQIMPMSNVGGSVEGKKDADGNSVVEAEVHVTVKDNDGNKVSVAAEGAVKSNNEGKVSTEGSVKISYDREF